MVRLASFLFLTSLITSCAVKESQTVVIIPLVDSDDIEVIDPPIEIAAEADDLVVADTSFAALEGLWVSLDDEQSKMRFEGENFEGIYAEEVAFSGTMTLDGDALVLTASDDPEPMRYSVVTLTETMLVVIYLDRGNTLKYRRVE